MNLALMIKLIPMIINLMTIAEGLIQTGGGELKKELVMEGTKAAIGAVSELSKGGQKQTWARISEPVSTMIDSLCTLIYPSKSDS